MLVGLRKFVCLADDWMSPSHSLVPFSAHCQTNLCLYQCKFHAHCQTNLYLYQGKFHATLCSPSKLSAYLKARLILTSAHCQASLMLVSAYLKASLILTSAHCQASLMLVSAYFKARLIHTHALLQGLNRFLFNSHFLEATALCIYFFHPVHWHISPTALETHLLHPL